MAAMFADDNSKYIFYENMNFDYKFTEVCSYESI